MIHRMSIDQVIRFDADTDKSSIGAWLIEASRELEAERQIQRFLERQPHRIPFTMSDVREALTVRCNDELLDRCRRTAEAFKFIEYVANSDPPQWITTPSTVYSECTWL